MHKNDPCFKGKRVLVSKFRASHFQIVTSACLVH